MTPLRRSFLNFLQNSTAHRSTDVTPVPIYIAVLASAGAAVHIPRLRRCGDPGKDLQGDGSPGSNSCRSRHRVRIARFGSVGISTRCHPRLLPTWKANGQCLHRSVQRPLPGGMSQCTLVPQPCDAFADKDTPRTIEDIFGVDFYLYLVGEAYRIRVESSDLSNDTP